MRGVSTGHVTRNTSRREWLIQAIASATALSSAGLVAARDEAVSAFAALEARAGGRLGVCVLNTATGRLVGRRLDQRFAMCSTFKLLLAGVILREVDRGRMRLDERLAFSTTDMLEFAPVTSRHLAEGAMTVAELAEAAQTTSDNVAANVLLRRLGGPAAFTRRLREVDDRVTRLDRWEVELNLVRPGETRDTTTPHAFARTAARMVVGDLLSTASRARLAAWMVATTTGAARVRAGLPPEWRAGDKTGTAQHPDMTDKVNDVAVVWPPDRSPMIVAAFYDSARRSTTTRDEDQALLGHVGRIAAAWANSTSYA